MKRVETSQRILVLGASGYVGGRLVRRLLIDAYAVRCLARDPRKLAGREWPGVEIYEGDVLDRASLIRAMIGCSTVYYLVHSMYTGIDQSDEWDKQGARNVVEASEASGIQRIVYLGGLGSRNGNVSRHVRSRNEVGEILASGTVPVTEFRAAMILGSGSASFDMMHALVNRQPVMVAPRWVNTLSQPISIRDVIRYLVGCLTVPESIGKVIEIGGADILSYKDMMLRLAKQLRLRRIIIVVPVVAPGLSAFWINLITPIPASVARPLVEGFLSEMIVTNDLARQLFPLQPMGFDESVVRALQRVRDMKVETTWSNASLAAGVGSDTEANHLGELTDIRQREVAAPAGRVFEVFSSIGGQNGWYFANILWRIRGFLDKITGGVGLRRGRRHPVEILPGEALDFWRVETVEAGRRMVLRAEMKVPGRAWLEFQAEPIGDSRTMFTQTARFYPRGVPGLAYWYGIYPVHVMVFAGVARAIAHRSERGSRGVNHGQRTG